MFFPFFVLFSVYLLHTEWLVAYWVYNRVSKVVTHLKEACKTLVIVKSLLLSWCDNNCDDTRVHSQCILIYTSAQNKLLIFTSLLQDVRKYSDGDPRSPMSKRENVFLKLQNHLTTTFCQQSGIIYPYCAVGALLETLKYIWWLMCLHPFNDSLLYSKDFCCLFSGISILLYTNIRQKEFFLPQATQRMNKYASIKNRCYFFCTQTGIWGLWRLRKTKAMSGVCAEECALALFKDLVSTLVKKDENLESISSGVLMKLGSCAEKLFHKLKLYMPQLFVFIIQ